MNYYKHETYIVYVVFISFSKKWNFNNDLIAYTPIFWSLTKIVVFERFWEQIFI